LNTAAILFSQGLPDPRGCEYRECWAGRTSGPDRKLHGWILPKRGAYGKRFAIQWNGVICPVNAVGRRLDLGRDVDVRLRTVRDSSEPWDGVPLALLLRLGEAGLAERVWMAIGESNHDTRSYLRRANAWTDANYWQAGLEHVTGDDRVALARLLFLHSLLDRVEAEATRQGVPATDPARTTLTRLRERVSPLLDDQRRRALEAVAGAFPNRPAQRPAKQQVRIAALIRQLDQVNAFPLEDAPQIRALIRVRAAAVTPLLEVVQHDLRLTRSQAFESFDLTGRGMVPVADVAAFTRGPQAGLLMATGEMVPVADAALVALAGIVGRSETQTILGTVEPRTDRSDKWFRARQAGAFRLYLASWHYNEGLLEPEEEGTEGRFNLFLTGTSLRESLARIMQKAGRKYVVSPEVPDIPIYLALYGVSVERALRLLNVDLYRRIPYFRMETETEPWLFTTTPWTPPTKLNRDEAPTPSNDRISFRFNGTPLREALDQILRGKGDYSVDSNVPDLPIFLDLHDVPYRQATRRVVMYVRERVPGFAVRSEDFLMFQLYSGPDRPARLIPVIVRHKPSGPKRRIADQKFDMEFAGVSLRDGLAWLMQGVPEEYSVDARTPDVPVNLQLQNVTIEEAMRAFVRTVRSKVPGFAMRRKSQSRVFTLYAPDHL
jgi:hypothetical protein